MTATATKLPTSSRPLIQDRVLAAAILAIKEGLLAKVSGRDREHAEARIDAAFLKVRGSGYQAPHSKMVERYRAEMTAAARIKES